MYSTYIFPKKQVPLQKYFNKVKFTPEEIDQICKEAESLPIKEGETVDNEQNRSLDKSADRKSTRLNSSHIPLSRMPSSA